MSQVSTFSKSIKFNTDRGNDIYRPGEEIKIKIDPASCPLLNTNNSYLQFSFQIPNSKNYVVPSEKIGCMPFQSMTIMDGNEQTVLEDIQDLHLLHCMKDYYGQNKNDRNLKQIFEGLTDNAIRKFKATDLDNYNNTGPQQNYLGGGVQNQYYQIEGTADITHDTSRKVQVLYRFNLSGLLNPLRSEVLPIIALQGLVIRLKLLPANAFLRVLQVQEINAASNALASTGYGRLSEGNVVASDPDKCQSLADAAGTAFLDDKNVYGYRGYIAGDGTRNDNAALPLAETEIQAIILQNEAQSGNKCGLCVNEFNNGLRNCLLKVGGKLKLARTNGAPTADGTEFGVRVRNNGDTADATISRITSDNTNVIVYFDQTGGAAKVPAAAADTAVGTPIIVDLSEANTKNTYQVSDIQLVCDSVKTDVGYLQTLVQKFSSGNMMIQYNCWDDYRINTNTGSNIVESYIPANNTRAYALFNFNENLVNASQIPGHEDILSPPNNAATKISEYQFNINGVQIPQLPVKCDRVSENRVSPLQIIELEKALDQTDFKIKSIVNPGHHLVIGRGLGRDGSSFNLAENSLRLRVRYDNQSNNLLQHNLVYSTKAVKVVGGNRVVIH